MTPGQLRKALEAWRAGDRAALRRVLEEARRDKANAGPYLTRDQEGVETYASRDTADAFVYGIGPAFAYIRAQREDNAARQEFDLELTRKPNGSYS